jgi:hypothetical protein
MNRKARVGVVLSVLGLLVATGCDSPVRPSSDTQNPNRQVSQQEVRSILAKLSTEAKGAGQVWRSLSPEAQKAVVEALKVASVETSVRTSPETVSANQPSAALTTCKGVQISHIGKNLLGMRIWGYFSKIDFCYANGKIASKTWTKWGEVYYIYWAWKGNIGTSTSGGVGSTSYRGWTQGSFAYCVPYALCAQNKYPWLDLTVYGTGSYTYNGGGW